MSEEYKDIIAQMSKRAEEEWNRCKEAATPILEKLAAQGVHHVIARYDGSGDSGSIEDITLCKDEGDDGESVDVKHDGPIENLCYAALEQFHGGWENNEGASGEVKIYLADRKITINHGQRVEETIHSDHEIGF